MNQASNGQEALDILENEEIHLMIPRYYDAGMDGLEVCRVRGKYNIPILMLNYKAKNMDKIQGL